MLILVGSNKAEYGYIYGQYCKCIAICSLSEATANEGIGEILSYESWTCVLKSGRKK